MNLKSFIKGSGILIVSNVILKAMNFFLMPLYTKYLTTEMMGISDTVTSFTGLLLPLFVLGLDSAFSAFYYDKGEKQAEKVFNTVWFTLLGMGIVPLLLCGFSTEISAVLFKGDQYSVIVMIALVSVSMNILYMPFALNLRMKNKMLLYGVINIAASFCMILLNILFVVIFELGTVSLALSTMFVQIIQLFLFVFANREKVRLQYFDRQLLRKMFCFAAPMIPGVILSWVLSLSDRYIILHFHSAREVGLYGVGTRLLTILNIFISSITMAYTTFAYGSKNDSNAKEKYIRVFDLMVLILGGICFTLALFGQEVVSFMTAPEYHSAYVVVRDLMFAQLFYGITSIVAYGILFEKKSVYALIANCLGAVANIALNLYLIPQYGIAAAAFTTLLGYILTFFCTYVFAQRLYYCRYKIGKAFVFLIALYSLSIYFSHHAFGIRVIIWIITAVTGLMLYKSVMLEFCSIFISKRKKGNQLL